MMTATIIGFAAAFLTTLSFVPQVIKVWKTKETKNISLLMYALFCVGITLWLVYGIMTLALPVIVANAVTLVLASIILVFKLKYT